MAGIAALGAEDSWSKVRELKGGAEIRVYKKGARQPILAKADEATDDKLVVVIKNEQVAIAKDEIDRIDARPVQSNSRVKRETRDSTSDPSKEPVIATHPREAVGPTSSSSTNFSLGSKPDFETIYRRAAPLPAK